MFVAFLCVLPYIYATLVAPRGAAFVGSTYNLDDHMVYAAWMRQAMDGAFLFDNRFTIDPQGGMTIHLYFLLLGWVAKVVGIPLAVTLAKGALAFAFVQLLGRLALRLTPNVFQAKLAVAVAVFGGGIGFAVWHSYGIAIVRTTPPVITNLLGGHLPVDVWQPEALAFPSLLTNSLFAVSLCLILGILFCVVAARDGWHTVPYGAAGMFVLMNIHSYDVAIVGLAMVGLLAMTLAAREFTVSWLLRCLSIVAGAIPPALYFAVVYSSDPVFAARANVQTLAPTFNQLFFGISLLVVCAVFGQLTAPNRTTRQVLGSWLLAVFLASLVMLSANATDAYWMGWGGWLASLVVAIAILVLLAGRNPMENLLWSWAVIGLIAPYIPLPFQRKLAMGIAIPWAILGAIQLGRQLLKFKQGERVLVAMLALMLLSWTSIRWLERDTFVEIKGNVSNTTMHQVFLHRDVREIIDILNKERKGRTVVLAMPGISEPHAADPDRFNTPYLPDLNPVLSGLAGVYTVAGHWGETPNYANRRRQATLFFLSGVGDEERLRFIQEHKVDYFVLPNQLAFPEVELYLTGREIVDLTHLGQVVYPGDRFMLVRVPR